MDTTSKEVACIIFRCAVKYQLEAGMGVNDILKELASVMDEGILLESSNEKANSMGNPADSFHLARLWNNFDYDGASRRAQEDNLFLEKTTLRVVPKVKILGQCPESKSEARP